MIKSEYEVLTKLDHPLMIELQEAYLDSESINLVFPLYTGGELHDLLYGSRGDKHTSRTSNKKLEPISEEELKPLIY